MLTESRNTKSRGTINPSMYDGKMVCRQDSPYTSKFLLTGYMGLLLRSTDVATASESTMH